MPGPVGPDGGCTAAGWSPDGSWMYFAAAVQGQSHIWRQRLQTAARSRSPSAPPRKDWPWSRMAADQSCLPIGVHESSIWIHDATEGDPCRPGRDRRKPLTSDLWIGQINLFPLPSAR